MNKTTKTLLYIAGAYVVGYLIWKNMKKNKSKVVPPPPNEQQKNAIGGSGIGGVVVPRGKKLELLQSSPGVCGWYYEDDNGDLVWVASAQCPQAI